MPVQSWSNNERGFGLTDAKGVRVESSEATRGLLVSGGLEASSSAVLEFPTLGALNHLPETLVLGSVVAFPLHCQAWLVELSGDSRKAQTQAAVSRKSGACHGHFGRNGFSGM